MGFHHRLINPPTHLLNPMNPDNARVLRITAAAGTKLADPYSNGTISSGTRPEVFSRSKEVYDA